MPRKPAEEHAAPIALSRIGKPWHGSPTAMIFDPAKPFVLLDDASPGGAARLFSGINETIVAATADGVGTAFDRLAATAGNRAGFVAFEAGYALDPALAGAAPCGGDGLPLLWFGVFDSVEPFDWMQLPPGPARSGAAEPDIDEGGFAAQVDAVLARIAAGDVYQVNLTFAASVPVAGHMTALYARIRRFAAAPYSALLFTGTAWVLSFSPELFFMLAGGVVTTRPMKGTAPRGSTAASDDAAAAMLAADPKNRAENLMIVDLLRNDLARIAEPGSVAVPALFAVERYPTLLQMTSTITARTTADPVTVLRTLFPCGSITGAPKIAAIRAIAKIEGVARGLYTGSIGAITADGGASFNVAIRTLVAHGDGTARLGLGAGIVADSIAADEWRECQAKGAFLTRSPSPAIIETMRIENGVARLADRHLDRAAATACFLNTPFARTDLAAGIAAAAAGRSLGRLRLLIAPSGRWSVEVSPPPVSPVIADVALVPLPVDAADWRLCHKTTDRGFYDAARMATGRFEVVFANAGGHVTEGSFTNIFVVRDGLLLTPPAVDGLLAGVLRGALLASGEAIEAPLTVDDLAGGFLIGNALRGLVPARLI